MYLKTETLERASYVATIAACMVAVLALGFGYFQFENTQKAERETLRLQREVVQDEREAKAIDLTMKFNELEAERSGRSGRAWSQDNEAITIAESIFDLVGEDPGWKATVKWMVEDESKYAKDTRLDCDTYEPKFVAFVKTILGPNACE